MGRLRKTARFIFSIGGYDGLSPVRRESSAEDAARKQQELLSQQVELMGGTPPPPPPDPYRPAHLRAMDDLAEMREHITAQTARLREEQQRRSEKP